MRAIYLPIRAYGDFIITSSIIKNNFITPVPIILPDYLQDIFQAIDGSKYFDAQESIHYKSQPAFFELYKVRDINNFKRLINDLWILKSGLKKTIEYLVDYRSRRISFTGAHLTWPSTSDNIYDSKLKLLKDKHLIRRDATSGIIKCQPVDKVFRILIVPESRIKEKNIDDTLINLIRKEFSDCNFNVSYFSDIKSNTPGNMHYNSFKQLIELISTHDLVISAESLPYHLANYLNKPHFVVYKKSRHYKATFMTPFMIQNNSYATFTGTNGAEVLQRLRVALPA